MPQEKFTKAAKVSLLVASVFLKHEVVVLRQIRLDNW